MLGAFSLRSRSGSRKREASGPGSGESGSVPALGPGTLHPPPGSCPGTTPDPRPSPCVSRERLVDESPPAQSLGLPPGGGSPFPGGGPLGAGLGCPSGCRGLVAHQKLVRWGRACWVLSGLARLMWGHGPRGSAKAPALAPRGCDRRFRWLHRAADSCTPRRGRLSLSRPRPILHSLHLGASSPPPPRKCTRSGGGAGGGVREGVCGRGGGVGKKACICTASPSQGHLPPPPAAHPVATSARTNKIL